jgi:hypothetical protein
MRTKQPRENSKIEQLFRWTWVAASVGALAVSLTVFDKAENRDIGIVLGWVMMTLSFPASIVCAALYALLFVMLESLFGIQVGASRAGMAATWIGLFGSGYFQWFYVSPHLWQKYRRLRS